MNEIPHIDCEAVIRQLFAYIDGELAGETQQQIDAHLAACRSCFSRAEFERRLKDHLRALGRSSVPVELEQRIRAITSQPRPE